MSASSSTISSRLSLFFGCICVSNLLALSWNECREQIIVHFPQTRAHKNITSKGPGKSEPARGRACAGLDAAV